MNPRGVTDRDVQLHLLSLFVQLHGAVFLLLQPGLQVVDELLQLLLFALQTGSHLLGLGTQFSLGLELLLERLVLAVQLREERGS